MSISDEKNPKKLESYLFFPKKRKLWQQTESDLSMLGDAASVSPATKDPCTTYPEVPGITYKNFKLSSTGLTPEQRVLG